jgi:PEP-CTERM motif-containing protein
MRKSLWIIPVLFAAIAVPYANADSISDATTITTQADPKILFVCCNGEPTSPQITDLDVSFAANVTPILIVVTGPATGCTPAISSSAPQVIETCKTIEPGAKIAMTTAAKFVSACWTVGGICESAATPTPEPATGGLMLVGVGLVFVMRKRIG